MSRRGPGAETFRALGLDASADLTDDEVRAAWRRVATATHPDRADGGDPPRFAAAAAAYTALRTSFGRGEALADLQARRPRRSRVPSPWQLRPAASGSGLTPRFRAALARPASLAAMAAPAAARRTAASLVWRARRGRPWLLLLRVLVAAAVCGIAAAVAGAQPAAFAVSTGVLTWLALTARHDLAPPA